MHAETLARKLPSDIGDTCLASILLTGSTPAPHDPRRPSASPLAAEGRALTVVPLREHIRIYVVRCSLPVLTA